MPKDKNITPELNIVEGELRAKLIQLREDAGYTIPQMADALCLSENVISKLENEDFENLAEPPYIRGYLRNYAKIGENDPNDLITIYESLRGADASELDYRIKGSSVTNSSSKRSLSPIFAQLIFLGVLLAGIIGISMIPGVNQWIKNSWASFSSQFSSDPNASNGNPDLIGSLPVPIPLPEDTPPLFSENPSNNANSQNSAENTIQNEPLNAEAQNTEKSLADIEENNAESATQKAENKNVAENIETPVTKNDETESDTTKLANIKLIFNKDVWLRIKDKNSKTVYEALNKTGTDKTLEFEKPLTFRVGNAQGLSIFVDDKAFDISQYINGSIANFTLE